MCKRWRGLAETPEGGWRQVRTVWEMRNSNARIFTKSCFNAFEN
jgi:hypothetical protein